MKWLEIIELRLVESERELVVSKFQTLVNELELEAKEQEIKSYYRVMIDTDFSIHLFHDSKKVESNGSPLGLRLASALKAFGLIKHSVWLEMDNKGSKKGLLYFR